MQSSKVFINIAELETQNSKHFALDIALGRMFVGLWEELVIQYYEMVQWL